MSENDVPNEVLIRAAYALLLAADTIHETPTSAARWRSERETFMLAVQRQVLGKGAEGTGGECGCGHPASAHNADGCTEWWRYPDVLNARPCGCTGVWNKPA